MQSIIWIGMDEPRTDIFAAPAPAETPALEIDADELADARSDDAWRALLAEGERYVAEHTRNVSSEPIKPVGTA